LSDEDYMLKPKRVKIKGYARISTNLGNLNVELNPEFAPKAVYNFVKLSQKGYYDGTVFHRNIRNFMVRSLFSGSFPLLLLLCYLLSFSCRLLVTTIIFKHDLNNFLQSERGIINSC